LDSAPYLRWLCRFWVHLPLGFLVPGFRSAIDFCTCLGVLRITTLEHLPATDYLLVLRFCRFLIYAWIITLDLLVFLYSFWVASCRFHLDTTCCCLMNRCGTCLLPACLHYCRFCLLYTYVWIALILPAYLTYVWVGCCTSAMDAPACYGLDFLLWVAIWIGPAGHLTLWIMPWMVLDWTTYGFCLHLPALWIGWIMGLQHMLLGTFTASSLGFWVSGLPGCLQVQIIYPHLLPPCCLWIILMNYLDFGTDSGFRFTP